MQKIFSLTLLILLLPVFAYAQYNSSNSYLVYTWGYQDIMVSMLEAVKYFMGTESFGTLVKIAMALSAFTILLSLMNDKAFSPILMFQKILLVIGVQVLLISSPMDIVVKDISGNGALTAGTTTPELVRDVPGVVGFPIYVLSTMEYSVRNSLRSSLNYGGLQGGAQLLDGFSVITALNLLQSTTNVRIYNPNFNKSFRSFVENCALPDMVSGHLDVRTVTQSSNLWQLFGQDLHHARIGSFYMGNYDGPDGEIMTCDQLYAAIDRQFATVSAEAEAQLKAGLGLSAGVQLNNAVGAISSAIMKYQTTGADLITNSMAINSFNDSYDDIASGLGMDTSALAYSMAKAQETARLNASMQGIMAKKYMPIAKGYLTVIFVAIIPLIFIIALVTSNFKKPFAMIFGLLVALALWNIGDQLLDFIILVRTQALFSLSNIGMGTQGYSMETQPFINAAITDTLSLSLGMYWMIPTLALSVATLSGYGAAGMMSGISGIANAGVSSAAAEAAGGNMNYGNARLNTVNMNKYDATQAMSAGTSSKLSMDKKETASNESSVKAGSEQLDFDKVSNEKTGTMMWRDEKTGDLYRAFGDKKQTSGGFQIDGMIQNLTTGETLKGSVSGLTKDMNSTSNGQQSYQDAASHFNMSDKEKANLGDAKGENITFMDNMTNVDFKGSASHVVNKDDIHTENIINENKKVDDDSHTKKSGTKVEIGDEVKDSTGALAMVKNGLSQFGVGNNNNLMTEAFLKNMTDYQDSILQKSGNDQISEQQALSATGAFKASAGFKALGNGATVSLNAALEASVDHKSGLIDTANLNRLMNAEILKGLDADAKANNWTTEQYDEAARERFGAYNDFLKNELGNQTYGPGNVAGEVLNKGKDLMEGSEEKANEAINKLAKK